MYGVEEIVKKVDQWIAENYKLNNCAFVSLSFDMKKRIHSCFLFNLGILHSYPNVNYAFYHLLVNHFHAMVSFRLICL